MAVNKEIFGWFNFDDIYVDAINKAKNGSCFLEIGCFFGKSTEFLCRKIKESKKDIRVYVIDVFITDYPLYVEILEGRSMLEIFKNNLEEHKDILEIHQGSSSEMHKLFKDNFFDMIFIDGDHNYSAVKKDLISYYPKLKEGGIFAGHDYTEDCGVPLAVDEFANENKLNVNVSRTSWIIKKQKYV
jgi:predicted O-methyltransferase YrrM